MKDSRATKTSGTMRWRSGQTIACLVRESALSLTPVINGDDAKGKMIVGVEKERRAESKGVGKDSRSALCEVAVVRGIGIIACMGQKHVGVLGSRSSLWCVRVVVSFSVQLFPVSFCMYEPSLQLHLTSCRI